MIQVTRLDGKAYFLNPHQIESLEALPDTTLQLLNGKRIVVKETPVELVQRIILYRRQLGLLHNEE